MSLVVKAGRMRWAATAKPQPKQLLTSRGSNHLGRGLALIPPNTVGPCRLQKYPPPPLYPSPFHLLHM